MGMTVGDLLVKIGADFTQYNKDLAKAEGMARKSGSTIGDVFKNAMSVTLGMSAFEALKAGIKSVTSAGIGFNSMLQTARIGFSTMLGCAQRAEGFLSQIADFAKTTPFEFPELLDASKRMLAYGFAAEEIIPTLRAVGDASAGLGAGKQGIDRITLALGQIRAKGKLSAEEMRQLTEAGVPAWDMLAEAMGKTTAEIMDMQQKGLIPANKAVKTIVKGMEKRFGGMMKNMENTWEGVTSTIKDVWNMTIGELSKNLFKGVNEWLMGVRDFSQRFYDALKAGGLQNAIREVFGSEAANAFSLMDATVRGAWNIVSGFFNFVRNNWSIFRPITIGALWLFASLKLVATSFHASAKMMALFRTIQAALAGESLITSGILGLVSKAIGTYRLHASLAPIATNIFTASLYKLQAALYATWTALGPIGWAVLTVAGVLGIGIGLWNRYNASLQKASQTASQADLAKGFRDVEKSSQAAANGIGEQTDAMGDAKKAAKDNLQSFDEVHQIQDDMGDASMALDMPTLDTSALGMPEMPDMSEILAEMEQAKPTIAGFWEWIKQGAANTWEAIKTNALAAWNFISTTIGGIWDGIATKASAVWGAISTTVVNVWNWLSGLVDGIFGPIGTFISTTWDNLLTTTTNIWGIIWTTVSDIWNDFLTMSNTIFGSIWTFITDTWNNLWLTASTVWGLIWTFLSGLWNNIWTTASTIWQAIADFITGKIDLRTAVKIIWGAITGFFSETWNSIYDTASGVWGTIAKFFVDTWEGLKTSAGDIWGAVATFFSDTWNNIKKGVFDVWGEIKDFFITTWDNLKTTAQQVWGTIESYIIDPMKRVWTKLMEIWGNIKTYILGKWDEIKQGISSKANAMIDAIKSPFNIAKDWIDEIIDDAFNWGKNLIENFIGGIKSVAGGIKDAVSGAMSTVEGWLGFHSPTKEGPGRYADQWAPNLIRMYADGIIRNTGLVESAASGVASSLSGMSRAPSTSAFAGATARGGAAPEIHLHVGALIADDHGLKKLERKLRGIRIYEDQRVGDSP